jgi:hypothetical protein
MKMNRRTWAPIDYLYEGPWQDVLEQHQFWRDPKAYLSDGSIHAGLAYFVMVVNGQIAFPGSVAPSKHPFDQVEIPPEVLASPQVQSLLSQWSGAHAAHFGQGSVLKCGFYCVAPGGSCGYHVDGSVLDVGTRVDLNDFNEWNTIATVQCSHRTVMPLRMNVGDEFLIAGMNVRMTPGLLFEFSNTLPHAFFNKGPEYTVLLVTTWAAQADMLQHSLVNLK